MKTCGLNTVSMTPVLPLTKPLSLSRFRVNRTRMPGCRTMASPSALGSPCTHRGLQEVISCAASGNSARTRAKLSSCAPLFVTVRNVKARPVCRSKRKTCRTVVSRSLEKQRPAKKFSRQLREGWWIRACARNASMLGSVDRAAACCWSSTCWRPPAAWTRFKSCRSACTPRMG